MDELAATLDRIAVEHGFSGVVRVDLAGEVVVERAHGLADRAHGVANTPGTRFATASGTKGLTALTVLRLVEEGLLSLGTRVRELLGDDLPLVPADVTVEHLLAHRSGIGDYVDEDAIEDIRTFFLPVPPGRLASTTDYLAVLDGLAPTAQPGERFSYCNSGFVVLALVAERATGRAFADLLAERVCAPAGMTATSFLRSDELPADAAVGYLDDGLRSNVHHLPVRGSGDGGCYSTVADVHALWTALDAGEVVDPATYAAMVAPRSTDEASGHRYGLGFWRSATGDGRWLEGSDAGVSFLSVHDPSRCVTTTVISNTTDGARPLARHLRATVGP